MNNRIDERVECPFYIGVSRSKNNIGIKCEPLSNNLGFKVVNYTRLQTTSEFNDYLEIFCCDMWQTCPYAIALNTIKYK